MNTKVTVHKCAETTQGQKLYEIRCNDIFGDRIVAEYHNNYMTVNQKAAYQITSDIN